MVHPRVLRRILKSDVDKEESVVIVCVIVNSADRRSTELFFGSEQLRIAATTNVFDDAEVGILVTLTGALEINTVGTVE